MGSSSTKSYEFQKVEPSFVPQISWKRHWEHQMKGGEKEGAEGRGLQLSIFGAQTILTVLEKVSKEHWLLKPWLLFNAQQKSYSGSQAGVQKDLAYLKQMGFNWF